MCSGCACVRFSSIRVVVHEYVLVNVSVHRAMAVSRACMLACVFGRGKVGSGAGGREDLSPPPGHLETE
jgi:hypothetical protein